jgi:tetratricopeptide (TPR) repeat protein
MQKKIKSVSLLTLIFIPFIGAAGWYYCGLGKSYFSDGEKPASGSKIVSSNSCEREYNLAMQLLVEKKFDRAEKMFEHALMKRPQDTRILIALARIRMHDKDYARALKLLDAALVIDKENPQALDVLGYLYIERGMLEESIICFEKVGAAKMKADPVMASCAFASMGRIYVMQGETSKAQAALRSALNLNPKNDAVFLSLAELSIRQKDFKTGIIYLENIVSSSDSDNELRSLAYSGLAGVYRVKGDDSKADDFLLKARHLNPDNPNLDQ